MRPIPTILKWAGLGLVVLLVVIQFVPYGRAHTDPTDGRRSHGTALAPNG